jgi:hypothetical protein
LVFKNSLTQYITKYISCHNPLALTFGHHFFFAKGSTDDG